MLLLLYREKVHSWGIWQYGKRGHGGGGLDYGGIGVVMAFVIKLGVVGLQEKAALIKVRRKNS